MDRLRARSRGYTGATVSGLSDAAARMGLMPHAAAGTGTELIEWFGSGRGDASTMGGKAASLERLARLGFEVPPGFALTTAAFDAHLSAISDTDLVGDALGRLPDEAARLVLVAVYRSENTPMRRPASRPRRCAQPT